MGHVVLIVLGTIVQMERRFIKERQREGIERAKAKGRYVGGKRRIDRRAVLARKAAGESAAMIATSLGCSRMQIHRVLAGGAWSRCAPIEHFICRMMRTSLNGGGYNFRADRQ